MLQVIFYTQSVELLEISPSWIYLLDVGWNACVIRDGYRTAYMYFMLFTARRYDSAVFAVVVCPSVRSSQNGIVSKRLGGSSWYLAQSLPSVYPTLCCKEIWYFQKVKYLHVELCPKLRTLENFATACWSRCQQNSSSSSSTVEFVDDIYATIDEARLFLLQVGQL